MALGLGIGLSIAPGRNQPGVAAYQTACFVVTRESVPPFSPSTAQSDYYCFEVAQ